MQPSGDEGDRKEVKELASGVESWKVVMKVMKWRYRSLQMVLREAMCCSESESGDEGGEMEVKDLSSGVERSKVVLSVQKW